jgi:hypothetical protein
LYRDDTDGGDSILELQFLTWLTTYSVVSLLWPEFVGKERISDGELAPHYICRVDKQRHNATNRVVNANPVIAVQGLRTCNRRRPGPGAMLQQAGAQTGNSICINVARFVMRQRIEILLFSVTLSASEALDMIVNPAMKTGHFVPTCADHSIGGSNKQTR